MRSVLVEIRIYLENMIETHQKLKQLQQRILERKEEIYHDTYSRTDSDYSKVLFVERNKLFHVLFYGSVMDESFLDLLVAISQSEIAVNIESLIFHEADEGANGTMELDFTELIESNAIFSNLKYFYVKPYQNRWHNHPLIDNLNLQEEDVVSNIIAKMPSLKTLTLPNAPRKDFFKLDLSNIYSLNIYSGYEAHNFILNLSHSSNLPKLRLLQFGEYNERYMNEYPQGCTVYEHYAELFNSKVFSGISRFIIRHSILSEDQIEKLKQIRTPLKYNSFDIPSDDRPIKQQHLIFDFSD